MKNCIETADAHFIRTYNRFPIVLDHGEGVYLYDDKGKKYLDFAAGIAVFALGYGNKEYNDALKNQIDKLLHTSNLFYNEPSADAALKICEASGMDRVFFTNSGTEAVEGALKLARRYFYNKKGTNDGEIIAMNKSFHGRSTGSLAVTGQPKYQEAFRPLMGGIKFADFNDIDSVRSLINDNTCAIIFETIQGEGGIYSADESFIKEIRKICDEKDILLILDEIQCGMGRSGYMFAYQAYGIKPDIITCAKALGCGVPVGCFAAAGKAAEAMVPGDHGSTYGGNPFVCTAVSKVFEIFEKEDIVGHVKEVGDYLFEKLEELKNESDSIVSHRGKGLMQGLEFNRPVGDIIKAAQKEGLIIISAGANIIRFVPPLVIERSHVDEMTAILKKCMN